MSRINDRINAELDRLEMTINALEWLERVTPSNEGKNLFLDLKRSLHDSVQRAYDRWNEPEEEKPTWHNSPKLTPDKVYYYSLKLIHAEVCETIREAVASVADGTQKPDPVEWVKRLEEGIRRIADAQEEHGDILKTLAGNRKRTKDKQRKAGKRSYKETRKKRDDRARKDQKDAIRICERIIKTMSDNGKTFAKKEAVYAYVIDNFESLRTKGSKNGCLLSSMDRKLKVSTFKQYYLNHKKQKGTPSCK